jgi:hypothetical protein
MAKKIVGQASAVVREPADEDAAEASPRCGGGASFRRSTE